MGINVKTWRMIKSFYEKPTCRVQVNGKLSEQFVLQRGVRHGSVLSPILFLILTDSLLADLAQANWRISIKGVYTGSFGHADDVRSVAADLMFIKKQASIVKSFAEQNLLTLNLDKLEILKMTGGKVSCMQPIQIDTKCTSPSESSKYLGVVWMHNLSPKQSITLNINKARRAVLHWALWELSEETKTLSLLVKFLKRALFPSVSMALKTGF